MKKNNSLHFALMVIIAVAASVQGCKKNSTPSVKGCNDPEALNYSAADNGTNCTYPSDKLAGTWKVAEYESTTDTTINYTATITKIDNKTINIKHNSDYPSPPPSYHMNDMTLQIQWSDKTFVPSGPITGTISDVNSKWVISYKSSNCKVRETFTK